MKVLLSPSSFGQVADDPIKLLVENKFELVLNPYGRKLTEAEVILLAKDCVGIIAGLEPLNENVIDSLPALKCISRVGVGMDNVDMAYASKKDISVVNTPDGPTRAVAELTLGMAFSLLRKIPQADASMKNRQWKKQVGNLLQNKVIGVLGMGRIGKMVAEFFRALGNPVIGFDVNEDAGWAEMHAVKYMSMHCVLRQADIITLHVPGSKSPIISFDEFKLIRKSALLINISRGGIVDEIALHEALVSGSLAGAAVDVFSEEPYKGPLCDLENIILTPHVGSYAEEGKLQMEIDSVRNLVNELKKKNII
jgi:D-3-phosphoglycerate dehydrogenase